MTFESLEAVLPLDGTSPDIIEQSSNEQAPDLVAFAQALSDAGAIFYGASWCPHCTAQKELFEDGQDLLPFVEVTNLDDPNRSLNQTGIDAEIESFPTWVFPDGSRQVGTISLADLSARANVPIPTSNLPTILSISDVTLRSGAPLHIPLNGYDPNGGALHYEVTTDNPQLELLIPQSNRSARISVAGWGDMVFQLFDNRAPRATDHFVTLADDDFFDGISFHRIIDDFVIQGGDPTGTGSGGSPLGDFDDEYHEQLMHTSEGILSMAKSLDDTNDSQFFVTDGDTRNLDGQHSILGRLVEGEKNRDAITMTATDGSDRPTPGVTMNSVEIFYDMENAVLMLAAPEGTSGEADVTVTVFDDFGNSFERTFHVTITPDTTDNTPWLNDIPQIVTGVDTEVTYQLEGFDPEGDAILYFDEDRIDGPGSESLSIREPFTVDGSGQQVPQFVLPLPATAPDDLLYSVDEATGLLTVTPTNGLTGVFEITVGVAPPDAFIDVTIDSSGETRQTMFPAVIDYQVVTVVIADTDPGEVTGTVFFDPDTDGVPDAGEAGLDGWTVFVDENDNQLPDNGEAFTQSDIDGNYSLTLAPGSHTVSVVQMPGYTPTLPSDASRQVTVVAGETLADQDFGEIVATPNNVELAIRDDSGVSDTDHLTNVSAPSFFVAAAQPGATLELLADGQVVGQTTSTGLSTVVSVDGATPLADGTYDITVRQTIEGRTGLESSPISVSIDATAPLFTTTPPATTIVDELFQYDPQTADEDTAGVDYVLTDAPAGVSFNSNTGLISWTPNSAQLGSHSFSIEITDRAGNTGVQNFSLEVTEVPPLESTADDYVVFEDQTLSVAPTAGVLLNDNDNNPDGLTATLLQDAQNGAVTLLSDGSFTYVPDANFAGFDSFTYRASDGSRQSAETTVTIDVRALNDAPTADDNQYETSEDTTLVVATVDGVLANDVDVEGDSFTAELVDSPSDGEVTLNPDGSFTYTPAPGFFGQDSFTYVAKDAQDASAPATVTINVLEVNDLPVALDDDYSIDEDTTLVIAVDGNPPGVLDNDTDVDGDTLTALLVDDVQNGSLTLEPDGSFSYTPAANFNGVDMFTYRASDGSDTSNLVEVRITVTPVDDAPIAVDDIGQHFTNSTTELSVDAATGVLANDQESDGETLAAVLVDDVQNGALTLNADGSFTYTPDAGFRGQDNFTYQADDGVGLSAVATVTIDVNDPPVAEDDEYQLEEDDSLDIDVTAGVLQNDTDPDGDALSVELIDDVQNGALTLNADGSFVYTPDANFNGLDQFTYIARDGFQNSTTATVEIQVAPKNDAPVGAPDLFRVDQDGFLDVDAESGVLANDTDAEGDPLSVDLLTNAGEGDLVLRSDGSFSYRPDNGFSGVDTFAYVIRDGQDSSAPVTVTIIVNGAPTAVADEFDGVEDTELVVDVANSVLLNDDDDEGDTLSALIVDEPTNGTVALNPDGSFTYTPDANFNGSDTFTYRASDGDLSSEPAEVTIRIAPVDDAPVAVEDVFFTDEDLLLEVTGDVGLLENDTDVDGDTLTVETVSGPANGQLNLQADGSFSYTPNANFNGDDVFTYRTRDPSGLVSDETSVTITVRPVNDAPVIDAIADRTTFSGQPVVVQVVADDRTDDSANPVTFSLVEAPDGATIDASGVFRYTPPSTSSTGSGPSNTTVTVTVQVSETTGDTPLSSVASFSVFVNSINPGLSFALNEQRIRESQSSAGPSFQFTPQRNDAAFTFTDDTSSSQPSFLSASSDGESAGGSLRLLQAASPRPASEESDIGEKKDDEDEEGDEDSTTPEESDERGSRERDSAGGEQDRETEEAASAADESNIERTGRTEPSDRAIDELGFSPADRRLIKLTEWSLPEWARASTAELRQVNRILRSEGIVLRPEDLELIAGAAQAMAVGDAGFDANLSPATGEADAASDDGAAAGAADEALLKAAYFMPMLVTKLREQNGRRTRRRRTWIPRFRSA